MYRLRWHHPTPKTVNNPRRARLADPRVVESFLLYQFPAQGRPRLRLKHNKVPAPLPLLRKCPLLPSNKTLLS